MAAVREQKAAALLREIKVMKVVFCYAALLWPNDLYGMFTGSKTEVEAVDNKMFRVRSQISITVLREDDEVPFVCMVDHPAVKDLETRQYIEVQCE